MLEPQLTRADMNDELTKLLHHGFGSLTIKVHEHRISALDIVTRIKRTRRSADADGHVDDA